MNLTEAVKRKIFYSSTKVLTFPNHLISSVLSLFTINSCKKTASSSFTPLASKYSLSAFCNLASIFLQVINMIHTKSPPIAHLQSPNSKHPYNNTPPPSKKKKGFKILAKFSPKLANFRSNHNFF